MSQALVLLAPIPLGKRAEYAGGVAGGH